VDIARAAQLAETVAEVIAAARAEADQDQSARQLAAALKKASAALHDRLSEAYAQRLLPSQAIAPFSSEAADLDGRCEAVGERLGRLGCPPDAPSAAQVLIEDYRQTRAVLDRQVKRLAMQTNPTLSKYALAYGAYVASDPIALDAVRKCGLTPETLSNKSTNVDKVVKYLELTFAEGRF
jgi:hypothetical protein